MHILQNLPTQKDSFQFHLSCMWHQEMALITKTRLRPIFWRSGSVSFESHFTLTRSFHFKMFYGIYISQTLCVLEWTYVQLPARSGLEIFLQTQIAAEPMHQSMWKSASYLLMNLLRRPSEKIWNQNWKIATHRWRIFFGKIWKLKLE